MTKSVPVPAEPRPTLAIASPQPPVSVLPAPTPGRSLAYAELSGLQGRRIEVESTYGSVRRGTLQKYTDTAITIRLEQRERGLEVTMPHQTVREVRLIEFRPLLDDPPSGG